MAADHPSLACPACRAVLLDDQDQLECTVCGRRFPVIAGIPDLRLWPDPYISIEADREKALRLHEECAGLSFRQSVKHYYETTAQVPQFQAERFARSLSAAVDRTQARLRDWESLAGGPGGGPLLDLGCGTAPLLVSAGSGYAPATGIDVALRWLIIARKRLREVGVDARVVCACAEALPFADCCFGTVAADSSLEHFRDQSRAMAEAARVLVPAGRIFIATPNRFSLGPDPHTGLPAGSLLPAPITRAYVRRRGGIPPVRRLLSTRQLEGLLRRAGLGDVRSSVPAIARAQLQPLSAPMRAAGAVYGTVRRTAPGRAVLGMIGPMLVSVARKQSHP